MAKKAKEDSVYRFIAGMERFVDRMKDFSDTMAKKADTKLQGLDFSYNKSEINQDGKKVVVMSNNKQLTITVNGKEVYKETE